MKILLTGGGTGGHFYPLIAVAEKIIEIADREKILGVKLYFMSDSPYDKEALFENSIKYIEVAAGKRRIYTSAKNFFDLFKMLFGCFEATLKMFTLYPDVVFAKGGYASFPALFAARILRIPVMIHESDAAPGRVNTWAGKFAKRIAVSWEETAHYFPKDRVAVTGLPIRKIIAEPAKEGAYEFLKLDHSVPTILILGGSQGAQLINTIVVDALKELVEKYQIIHQTGDKNFDDVTSRAAVVIKDSPYKDRYRPFPFLNELALKMSAGVAKIVISRAGSTIFEIASWGIPSIIIPFDKSNADHAKKNAYNYARTGSCSVIEEMNLTPNILISEIDRVISNPTKYEEMRKNAELFGERNGAEIIAKEIIDIGLSHE